MKRDLATILKDLKSGKAPQLLLLFGDDLQVQESCRQIVAMLVPEESQAFNLERFDGRTVSWDQVEGSLMTPPFLPAKKVVWVENAPYFFSREQKGELGEKILELWREGGRDAAVKLLADVLVVEGWTQERWERLDASSPDQLSEVFDYDGGTGQEEIAALLTFAKNRDLELSKRKAADSHRLGDLLDGKLPEWAFLLLDAVQVDRRTKLFKRLEELGATLFLGLERDRYGKVNRDSLINFILQRLRPAGKDIEPGARDMIVARAGDNLRMLQQEIDKLVLYSADHPIIRSKDVEAVVADNGEGWIFDLTRAVGDRDGLSALAQLGRLMGQGEHPLKILGTIASEVRRLLAARQILDGDLRPFWKRGISYQQFQQIVIKQGTTALTRSPYADYMCFQRAERFAMAELVSHMESLFEADLRLKSSRGQPRLILEKLILGMCLAASRNQPHGNGATA
ncbi:MAG TPA: DNA polymerase III subunit delta [Candidatus Limnocylindrales bacterium]|nr:DNA polymerase III subunit delta [Candidatus Limnocylindrales bacterium]